MSDVKGYLTTHVLDTAHGCPGEGIAIALYKLSEGDDLHSPIRECLVKTVTNSDGRCDQPILSAKEFSVGKYEIIFEVADYFRKKGVRLSEPAFLDDVVIRFGIADENDHYHVPLLVSPYSFSTYKGS